MHGTTSNDLNTSIINEEDDAEENYQSRKQLVGLPAGVPRDSGFLKLNEDSVNVELDTSRCGPTNLDEYGSKDEILVKQDDQIDTLEKVESGNALHPVVG